MSWLTEALTEIDKKITYYGPSSAITAGLKSAKNIITMAYIKKAESSKPTFANYANPDDMK